MIIWYWWIDIWIDVNIVLNLPFHLIYNLSFIDPARNCWIRNEVFIDYLKLIKASRHKYEKKKVIINKSYKMSITISL